MMEWASKYGEIMHIKLGGKDVIVLNSVEAADELLARRSSNYSNRPIPHVAHDILRDGLGITFMEYGPSGKVRPANLLGVSLNDSINCMLRSSASLCKQR